MPWPISPVELRPSAFLPVPLNKRRIDLALDEREVVEDLAVQGDGRLDALDREFGQGPACPAVPFPLLTW
jgi:hypothetical protein